MGTSLRGSQPTWTKKCARRSLHLPHGKPTPLDCRALRISREVARQAPSASQKQRSSRAGPERPHRSYTLSIRDSLCGMIEFGTVQPTDIRQGPSSIASSGRAATDEPRFRAWTSNYADGAASAPARWCCIPQPSEAWNGTAQRNPRWVVFPRPVFRLLIATTVFDLARLPCGRSDSRTGTRDGSIADSNSDCRGREKCLANNTGASELRHRARLTAGASTVEPTQPRPATSPT